MATTSRPSQRQGGDIISRAFMRVFRTVRRKLSFAPVSVDSPNERVLDALIHASVSRCIDFNVVANRTGKGAEEAFFLLSNLRGVCEDLIYLTYLCRMEEEKAEEWIRLLVRKNALEGLAIQRRFFDANNPFQLVLGGHSSKADERVSTCREDVRQFWKSVGNRKGNRPTVRAMAKSVGLTSTYDFIYFAASNFVHFNPQVLLRTGWGVKGEPVTFSIRHMHRYYQSFCGFYGAVLFIGFEASFGSSYLKTSLDAEMSRLIDLIGRVQRWPEIITFEEMNETPPNFVLGYAIGRAMREDDQTVPYGAILGEVQALKRHD